MSTRMRRPADSAGLLPLTRPTAAERRRLLVGEVAVPPRRRALRLRWGRYVVAAALLYGGWQGHREWVTYHQLAVQRTQLTAQASSLQASDGALRAQITYAQSDAYVRGEAAQLFGLVGPGELPLAPVQSNGAGGAQGASATAPGQG